MYNLYNLYSVLTHTNMNNRTKIKACNKKICYVYLFPMEICRWLDTIV